MILKKNVDLNGLRPEMAIAVIVVNDVYNNYSKELVITSITDGKHSRNSRHYIGMAIDTRTRYFDDFTKLAVADDIRDRLGKQFFVLVETNHIHIQFNGVNK